MSNPYIGEIRMFGGNFAPAGWALCQGQLLSISEYDTLFNLIGTTYGGDGQQTFGVPDLRGRVPVHQGSLSGGSTYVIGQLGGVETVTVQTAQMPAHTHTFLASNAAGNAPGPANNTLAASSTLAIYDAPGTVPAVPLNAAAIGPTGGSQPHDNMQPYLCVNFIIALVGVYPTQS